MSKEDYYRSKMRQTAPMAAPSAFGDDFSADVSSKSPRGSRRSEDVHFKSGDSSMIFNPETKRYVKIDGRVGQQVLQKYGYPDQEGGVDWQDYNQQLTKSFSELWEDLKEGWQNLWAAAGNQGNSQKERRKSSRPAASDVEYYDVEEFPIVDKVVNEGEEFYGDVEGETYEAPRSSSRKVSDRYGARSSNRSGRTISNRSGRSSTSSSYY